jgi:hypothetical protein
MGVLICSWRIGMRPLPRFGGRRVGAAEFVIGLERLLGRIIARSSKKNRSGPCFRSVGVVAIGMLSASPCYAERVRIGSMF